MTMTDTNQNEMLSSKEDKLKNSSREDQQKKEPIEPGNNQVISRMHVKEGKELDRDHDTIMEEKKVQQIDDIQSNSIPDDDAMEVHTPNVHIQNRITNSASNDSSISQVHFKDNATSNESMEMVRDDTRVEQEQQSRITSKQADSKMQINRTQHTNGGLQGVIDKLNTNDSPIQAVKQLTNAASYTVQWRANETYVNSKEVKHQSSIDDVGAMRVIQSRSIESKQHASKSILEQTVGKLKLSHATEAVTRTSDADTESANVQLQSSAPPDYLKELLQRSQVNRRKGFVPKRNPLAIYNRDKQHCTEPKSEPPVLASESANNHDNESSTHNGQSPNVSPSDVKPPIPDYAISRSPLRKLAPKPNGMDTGALSVAIGPTTPPTGLIMSPQVQNQHLISPSTASPKLISPPVTSHKLISPTSNPQYIVPHPILQMANMSAHRLPVPSRSPTTQSAHSQPRSPTTFPWVRNHQDQPLDLCTKSATSSETSSPPLSPSENRYNENEPMDLSTMSTDKPRSQPKMDYQPQQLPPSASGFWKTPPRVAMIHPNKHGVASSPMEADTPSDKIAANSPGLDNRKVPYGFIMSPEMIKGMVQMGGMHHPYPHTTSQYISPEGYPEGAILLPGSGPHYRLPRRIALQHDEPPTPERPYMCDQCGATFKRNKSLKQHVRVHLNQVNDVQGQGSSAVQQHQSQIQLEIKPHVCIVCQRKFAHHEQLKRHMRIHREDKSFVCEHANCGKKFNDSSQLRLHMRTHSDHKPFPCPFCTLRFKYSGDVKRHVRIHTGEKPYVCGYCKMRFTQSNTLKQHERTHTGERPYHCHKCGMTFTQSGSLKYHLAHRHPPDVKTVIITSNSQTMTSSSPMVQVMNMNQHGRVL